MEITQLSEDEVAAIIEPPVQSIPSKEDFIRQIEADYLVAQRDGDETAMTVLDERHAVVNTASDDVEAASLYQEHCNGGQ